MLNNYPFYIALILAIVFIIVLANKIKVAYPVLLVLAGLVISIIPGVPVFHIEPEVIFYIFLPPMLFEAAWAVSWKELWRWRRIISSFAFIIVFITAGAVAIITSSLIPGFTLALGFLLGAIVSPPDAVSAGAIIKFVKVPKRLSSLLEGESLLNDASALIIMRFALIAVMSGGLLMSVKRYNFLSATSMVQGVNVWENVILVLNGLVFMLIGLELPDIVHGLQNDGISLSQAIGYGILTTIILIVARMLSSYGAVGVTMIMRNFITVADRRNPGYKIPFLVGWTGMRGVVSLAAALSIPVQLTDGTAFPQRNLILFITFIVILLTLVVQGLSLPLLIKKLKIADPDSRLTDEEEYENLKKQLTEHTMQYLNRRCEDKSISQNEMEKVIRKLDNISSIPDDVPVLSESKTIYFDVLDEQRRWLLTKNREEEGISEEVIRKSLRYIDLEEERLRFG